LPRTDEGEILPTLAEHGRIIDDMTPEGRARLLAMPAARRAELEKFYGPDVPEMPLLPLQDRWRRMMQILAEEEV
jgi:hypothetical protein